MVQRSVLLCSWTQCLRPSCSLSHPSDHIGRIPPSRFLRGRSVAFPSGRGRPYLPSPGAGGWPKAGPRPLARATQGRGR
jgi:hypothetical protein